MTTVEPVIHRIKTRWKHTKTSRCGLLIEGDIRSANAWRLTTCKNCLRTKVCHAYWLNCRVSEGMFGNERLIRVHARAADDVEAFVPVGKVRGNGKTGRVQVELISRRDRCFVILPTPYSTLVPVNRKDVTSAT